jgi:alkylhydroperoxidase family enzyme
MGWSVTGGSWASAAGRGRTCGDDAEREDVKPFLDAGYTERQVLELVLAAAVKTISNYTNHLFDTPLDAPFRPREWKAV